MTSSYTTNHLTTIILTLSILLIWLFSEWFPISEFYTMAQWPKHRSFWAKIEWLLMWPIITILRMTIPTFWNSRFSILYVITFAMCVAWIGVLCYSISWMITLIGKYSYLSVRWSETSEPKETHVLVHFTNTYAEYVLDFETIKKYTDWIFPAKC